MAVNLSPVGGVAAQFFDNSGNVLTGGKINTYLAGTTTPATAYTTSAGNVAWTNPIVLNAAGRVPSGGEIWLTSTILYKFVLTDSNNVLIGTYDNISTQVSTDASLVTYTPAGAGAVTTTVQAKLRESVSVLDFMTDAEKADVLSGTGSIAVDVAIQTAINSTGYYDSVFFPAGKYRLTNTLLIPTVGARTFYGEGPNTSILEMHGASANTDIFARANPSILEANNINYMTFHDLGLWGASNSRHGFNWINMSRSRIENIYFESLAGAAVYNTTSLAVTVQNCWMSSCGWGVYGTGIGWTGMNGWNIHNCYIAISTNYGIYVPDGMTGSNLSGNTLESNKLGGIYFGQAVDGVTIEGCYFEGNESALTSTADIFLGATSYVRSIGIRDCWFNSNTAADNFYYPIRITYTRSCTIENNTVNLGGKFIDFLADANPIQTTFGKVNFWNGAYVPFNDFQPTINFTDADTAAFFVSSGNNITKDFNLNLKQGNSNLGYLGEFPYGGWTPSLPGASTFTRYPNTGVTPGAYNGNQSIGMLVRSGGTATLTKTLIVNNSNAAIVKNGLVTFSLDVYADTVTNLFFTLSLNDGGTQVFTASAAGVPAWVTYSVTGHFSSATTALNAVLSTNSDGAYWIANPRIYACADASLMVGFAGTPRFANNAEPTAGTWAVGDTVWNSVPVSGGTPGWVCTTAGTPGTWKAMANLA